MTFTWPVMLYLLFSIPFLVGWYVLQQRKRQRLVKQFASLGLDQASSRQKLNIRRHIPPAIFLLGLMILIMALARPNMAISLPRVEGTIILAFDVSGSMAADDMKPSRMDAAKVAAQEFVKRQPAGILIGVVAFSDSGFSVQAPTNDTDSILAAINRLKPTRGTSLGRGIEVSLTTIAGGPGPTSFTYSNRTPEPTPSPTPVPQGTYISAAIVMLTDGENNIPPDPLSAAQRAADRGVRIYTVGIGSAEGTPLKVEGFTVVTQLDEPMLEKIAAITDGAYYRAENEEQLRQIYNTLTPQLVIKTEKTEVTSLFAAASLVIFLMGGLFSLLWFSRWP